MKKKIKKKIDVEALIVECEKNKEIMKNSQPKEEVEEEDDEYDDGMCWGCLEETDGSESCGRNACNAYIENLMGRD